MSDAAKAMGTTECGVHTHATTADGEPSTTGSEGRLHAESLLQQRARSLENEIVHRKEIEAALRESLAREQALREQAERHVHCADMFAGMLGHDLRNPLGTITMGANFISRLDPDEKTARAATRIMNSAERMAKMIDQLLDFTRIRAAGGLKLNRVRVDLGHVCERVKEEIEAGNPACRITLKVAGNASGLWDCDRLLQVFSNLVGNAVSHGTGGVEVTIEADGSDASDVIASVRNAGAIADEVLPVIFDPFRGGARRHNTNGLGLGLFITRQIVLAHGGAISVTSNKAAGTAIDVRLPRSPPVAADIETIAV
ncbi:MAG: HAMP domain-containing histidine kinase [Deltaproteobacteria bacterium]|nr:HAMP domain-containing histidine kinase [Deltaproteobacteria bacterium]MDQ3300187.1 HAMP domain-containing histidine kinase [Myxococcota bacterium]